MLNLFLKFNLTIGAFTQGPVQVAEGAGGIYVRWKTILYDMWYISLNKNKISETFRKICLFRVKLCMTHSTLLSTYDILSSNEWQHLQSSYSKYWVDTLGRGIEGGCTAGTGGVYAGDPFGVWRVKGEGGQQPQGAQGPVHFNNFRCCSNCWRSRWTLASSICIFRTSHSMLPNCCSYKIHQ